MITPRRQKFCWELVFLVSNYFPYKRELSLGDLFPNCRDGEESVVYGAVRDSFAHHLRDVDL